MKLFVLLSLVIMTAQVAQAEVIYPDQTDLPNLECTLSDGQSVPFKLDAPKMIWQEKANEAFPWQKLYEGEVSQKLTGRYGLELTLNVKYSDSYFGKSVQYVITQEAGEHNDYTSMSNVVSVKSFKDFNFKIFQAFRYAFEIKCQGVPPEVPGT